MGAWTKVLKPDTVWNNAPPPIFENFAISWCSVTCKDKFIGNINISVISWYRNTFCFDFPQSKNNILHHFMIS